MKPTLVLGASTKTHRYSYKAISRLKAAGYEVHGLGLREGTVEGVDIKTDFADFGEVTLDTITLYLNAQRQEQYYDMILNSGAKRVIFNPGAENPELFQKLSQQGIEGENACTLVLLSLNQY